MCHCHAVGHLICLDNNAGALAAAPRGAWSVDSEEQKTCRSEKKNSGEVRAPRLRHVRRRRSFSGSEGNARVAAQRPLAAVALVFMDNSAVRFTFAAKTAEKKNLSDFLSNSFWNWPPPRQAPAQREEPPNSALCYAANSLSPEKNKLGDALKVKVASAGKKRKTKIMIALTCSQGAACSLKSSRGGNSTIASFLCIPPPPPREEQHTQR